MKRIMTTAFIIALFAGISKAQVCIPQQEIPYNVHYKWGLIDVMIAKGNVTIRTDGANFHGTLDGTSIPWEGRIICVSDTLLAEMLPADGLSRENVIYQNGWYRHPKVSDFRSVRYNPDDPAYFKNTQGGGSYDASDDTMEAIAVTADMLGMFYYAKEMDFDKLSPGDTFTMPIEGNGAKEVKVTYIGQDIYNINGSTYPTYDIEFEYSYDGSLSGYNVHSKIGATDRIPILISASLPLGQVEMIYNPD